MEKRYEERGDFYYFDFLFDENFAYNTSKDINIHELFEIYTTFNVDQGWIQVISNIKTSFSVQIFDTFPLPDLPINSMRFMGAHIFTDFKKVDDNLFHRSEDLVYLYETGFSLEGMRIRRLGVISEIPSLCRIKMIWKKLL